MPKVVTGFFKGVLLFMLLAGETFNRFHVSINGRELRLPAFLRRTARDQGEAV